MAKGIVRHPHAIDATSQRVPFTEDTALNLVQHGFRHFNCARPKYSSAASSPSGILRPNSLRCPRRGRGLLCRASVCKILASHFCPVELPDAQRSAAQAQPPDGQPHPDAAPTRIRSAAQPPDGQPHPDVAPLITPLGPRRRRRWAASSTPPPSSSSAPHEQETAET